MLLLGGISGAGKSTLARKIYRAYGDGCYNFDFGSVYTHPDPSTEGQIYRDSHWAGIMEDTLHRGLHDGYELIITASAFMRRERRDFVLDCIGDSARVLPIILGTPILTAYHRIKSNRPEDTHNVNRGNVKESLMYACKVSIPHDHTDILLPTNKSQVPGEYRALFHRNPNNRAVFADDAGGSPRWVMTPCDLPASTYIDLIQSDVQDPFDIRGFLESSRTSLEGVRSRGKEL